MKMKKMVDAGPKGRKETTLEKKFQKPMVKEEKKKTISKSGRTTLTPSKNPHTSTVKIKSSKTGWDKHQ